MIPAPQASAPWVGRTVTCAECGRGWRLEEGDTVERRMGNSSRGQWLCRVLIPLSCGHTLSLNGDAMHALLESSRAAHDRWMAETLADLHETNPS